LLALVLSGSPFSWPRPELIEEIPVHGTVQADGVPVRLKMIRSRLGVQELMQTYATAFSRAGFYVAPVQKRVVAEPHLTGLDVRTLTSYSVVLHPNEDGSTTCMLGEADLGAKSKAVPDLAPLFPGARGPLRTRQEQGGVLSYFAPASSKEVEAFYAEVLGKTGYRLVDGAWERKSERLQVLLQAEPGGTRVLVLQLR
jgi:hypothetical protein